jgi:hypothetical protein
VAHVHYLTAHFLAKEVYINDQDIIDMILYFVTETKAFLSESEVINDWSSWQPLRTYLCGVVEKFYDALSNTRGDAKSVMGDRLCMRLFEMCEDWCGHGNRSTPYRNREQHMRALGDAVTAHILHMTMEQERKALELAALNAMASLCVSAAGIVVYISTVNC